MKVIRKIIIGIILLGLLITFGFHFFSQRRAITEKKFVDYMGNNGYFIASNIIFTNGDEIPSGDENGLKMEIIAEIDMLNIKINYFDYTTDDGALKAYGDFKERIYNGYFFNQANHELAMLTNKGDYIKESAGKNYNRYLIKNPDKNVVSIVSRIENTIIVVDDVPELSYYKVRDSLGSIGY